MDYRPLNDLGFMADAANAALHSKDPSTKVGCIIIRPNRTKASEGFNGFPRGVHDYSQRYNDRPTKYALIVHAEQNAIVTAREPLDGYTLYCTLAPCSECAKLIIQAGIRRVVTWALLKDTEPELVARWEESHKWTNVLFSEAGVIQDFLVPPK